MSNLSLDDVTIVVPITLMSGKLHNLERWLPTAKSHGLSVILVHDKKDEETSLQLMKLLEITDCTAINLHEGFFGGPGLARNFGLSLVQTEWVAFWDSDDLPDLNVIQKAITLAKPEVTTVVTNFEILDTSSGKVSKMNPVSDLTSLACQVGIWRFTFRTRRAKEAKFGVSLMGEDQIFISGLRLTEEEIIFNSAVSYRYVKGTDYQLTSNPRKIVWLIRSLEEYLGNYWGDSLSNLLTFSIGIRMTLTVIKNGSPKQKIFGLRALKKVILRSRLGILNVIGILFRIMYFEVSNANQKK